MTFYKQIYNCQDGNYCIEIGTSSKCSFTIACNKHKLVSGNKFKYDLSSFIKRFSKNNDAELNVYEVELLEIRRSEVQHGYVLVAQLITNLQIKLDESKKIFFGVFNFSPSWQVLHNGQVLLTLVFSESNVVRDN